MLAEAAAQDYESEIEAQKRKLQSLKKQAEDTWKQARAFANQEKGVLSQLSQAEQALEASRRYLKGLNEREALLMADIRQTEGRLHKTHQTLEARREALRVRLRRSYMYGRSRPAEVLLSAESFPEVMQKSAFLSRVIQQDSELVAQVQKSENMVKDQLQELKRKQKEIDVLQADKAKEKDKHEQLKGSRERQLSQVRDQRRHNERAAKELERAAKEMEGVIAELERLRRAAGSANSAALAELDRKDFSKNRGRLPWPLSGPVTQDFGKHTHPKYGTVTINNGIDIKAPAGTAVSAVGDGVVEVVRWIGGYGQTIILNHGNSYYTIYAHLSAVHVTKGAVVTPGQVIGSVGDTGSLKGVGLHFELRSGSEALDPRRWLR